MSKDANNSVNSRFIMQSNTPEVKTHSYRISSNVQKKNKDSNQSDFLRDIGRYQPPNTSLMQPVEEFEDNAKTLMLDDPILPDSLVKHYNYDASISRAKNNFPPVLSNSIRDQNLQLYPDFHAAKAALSFCDAISNGFGNQQLSENCSIGNKKKDSSNLHKNIKEKEFFDKNESVDWTLTINSIHEMKENITELIQQLNEQRSALATQAYQIFEILLSIENDDSQDRHQLFLRNSAKRKRRLPSQPKKWTNKSWNFSASTSTT